MRIIIENLEKERIERMLLKRYSHFLNDEIFKITGEYSMDGVILSLSLEKKDRTYQYLIEVFISLKDNQYLTKEEAKNIGLDFFGYFFDEFFKEKREISLLEQWEEITFDNYKLMVRGEVSNPLFDNIADKIIERGIPLTEEEKKNFSIK